MNSVGASISSNSVIGTGVRNRSKYKVKALERLTSLPRRHTDRVSDIRPRNANKFKKANDNMLSEQMVDIMLVIISVGNRNEMKMYMTLRLLLHYVGRIKNPRRLIIIDVFKFGDPIVYISFAVSVNGRQSIQAVVINVNTQRDLAVLEVKSFEGLPRSLDRVSDIRPESANKFKKAHDNTLSEQMVDNMSVKMKSVGAIVSSNLVIGTVFRVGSKYVMTAFHVVEKIINPRKLPSIADDDWSKLDDPTVYIRFTASVMDLLSPIFYIKPDVIYMNKQLDVAVLELTSLEGLPPSLKLSKDMGHVKCVNIIGFGHPTDLRKQLDANCEVLNINYIITAIDNYFKANPSVLQLNGLEPGGLYGAYNELRNPNKFPCHTFLEPGSSGAPAIEENEVVGILVEGIPAAYYKLKDSSYFTASGIDKLPKNLMFELCVKTESIFNDMRYVVPMLAADLFA